MVALNIIGPFSSLRRNALRLSALPVLRITTSTNKLTAVFLKLDQRAQKIPRVHERNALAVHVQLRAPVTEHVHAFGPRTGGCCFNVIDIETEVMHAATGIFFEEFGDG